MKITLLTDFNDYYDPFFDKNALVCFSRFAKSYVHRKDSVDGMARLGMTVVYCAKSQDLQRLMSPTNKVVVYIDPYEHRGEGKKLLPCYEADALYPDYWASVYKEPDEKNTSYRVLSIGSKFYLLKYYSHSDWRSNVGDGDIEFLGEHTLSSLENIDIFLPASLRRPLYAIDFVKSRGVYYAIDFNTAPQIRGTGVDKVLMPWDCCDLIKEAVQK